MTEPEDRLESSEISMGGGRSGAARPSALLGVGGLVLVSALGIAILGGCMFFDEVDRCLDRGGAWNETTEACELHERPEGEASASEASPPTFLAS